jgi:hypothetical protein
MEEAKLLFNGVVEFELLLFLIDEFDITGDI